MKNKFAVVFDDHQLFAQSFARALGQLSLFTHVKNLDSIHEANKYFEKNKQTDFFIFCDYFMPDISIMEFWQDIKSRCPLAKVIVISSLSSFELIKSLKTNSLIQALISKSACFSEITACMDNVNNGKKYLSPYFVNILNKRSTQKENRSFTNREMEILHHISLGETIEQTAGNLNLSRHTIVAHRRNMMEKIECNSITELLAFAIKNDLIGNSQ